MRFLGDVSILRKFILPFITLTILPAIYIARITYITVQDEIRLEYIMSAKAKGLSRGRIFTSELLPAVSFRIVDSLPAIITMLFSNMIIVEYLFNYLGLMNYLIYFYNRQDINGFIATAVTMGGIYMLLTWGIQYLAGFINPLKRRPRR
jgi:ABC-type dipeptide/oligopeptide/nickel transport system permease component